MTSTAIERGLAASVHQLVVAAQQLAYELNSTPLSGPVCWCNPELPPGPHSAACELMRFAVSGAKVVLSDYEKGVDR